jgi:cation diffusion facilitator family transporter
VRQFSTNEEDKNKRIVFIALITNVAIAVSKLIAALITGSSAMLAEAAHTVADSGNEISLLLGLRLAARPPDPEHPFGHGKERYFWPFIASLSMFIIGGSFSVYRGIETALRPQAMQDIGLNYTVLGISAMLDGASFFVAFRGVRHQLAKSGFWRAIQSTKDPTLFNVLLEDTAALLGLGLAFVGLFLYQLTGIAVFDSAASVLIGLLLGGIALVLAYESRSLLLGEAASPETLQKIVEAVRRVPEVVEIVELLTMHLAPDDILVNMELTLKEGLTTTEVEKVIDRIEGEIRKEVPQARRIFIECETLKITRHDAERDTMSDKAAPVKN